MAKEIKYGVDARKALEAGVDKLANTVRAVSYTHLNRVSVQLLDKTRKINKLLHNNNSSKVVFNDICEVLTEILTSNQM